MCAVSSSHCAWHARTVNRAQGLTFPAPLGAFADLRTCKGIAGFHYTACTRVTEEDGLHFPADGGFDAAHVTVSSKVKAHMAHLRQRRNLRADMPLTPATQQSTIPETACTFIAQNVCSLPRHMEDVAADPDLLAADVVFFGETRVTEAPALYTLPGFQLLAHTPAQRTPTAPQHGSMLRVKRGTVTSCTCHDASNH